MKYKFLDIGTSYFCTSIDEFGMDVNGLLVEPVKDYFDILPTSPTVQKANYAISDSERTDVMYVPISSHKKEYHTEKEMKEMRREDAPIGVDGCSSLGKIHPEVPKFYKTVECQVITFDRLCEVYDIEEVEFLKIDTEGHDYIILEQVYQRMKENKFSVSDRIMCEYNHLINRDAVEPLIRKIEKEFGFKRKIEINIWNQMELILTKKRRV